MAGEVGAYLPERGSITLSYVSDDKNYTDPAKSGVDATDRAGRISDPPINEATDREKAAKMANLLEDLEFPATKEEIKNHVNRKTPARGNRVNDIIELVWNNLDDGVTYNSAYDIEKAAGLVKRTD
jgi:hypothetical protein